MYAHRLSEFLVRAYLFLYNPIRVIGLVLCSRSLVLIASISGRKETNQVLSLMKVTWKFQSTILFFVKNHYLFDVFLYASLSKRSIFNGNLIFNLNSSIFPFELFELTNFDRLYSPSLLTSHYPQCTSVTNSSILPLPVHLTLGAPVTLKTWWVQS